MTTSQTQKNIILVSGMSGAGRTTALKTLEDLGYECIDNMPLRLIPALLSNTDALSANLALGVDVRNHDITTHITEALDAVRQQTDIHSHILFLAADTDSLVKRFSETRRRHPLSPSRPLADSIALEEQLLEELKLQADTVLDTTSFKPADLKRYLTAQFGSAEDEGMAVFIQSFGFKRGLPKEADLVFDVRFLRNPYWDENLRHDTGLNPKVQAYVKDDECFLPVIEQIQNLLKTQLPLFAKSQKPYITIAVGCTGGQHRSVTTAIALGEALKSLPYPIKVHHRDVGTETYPQ